MHYLIMRMWPVYMRKTIGSYDWLILCKSTLHPERWWDSFCADSKETPHGADKATCFDSFDYADSVAVIMQSLAPCSIQCGSCARKEHSVSFGRQNFLKLILTE